MNIVDRVKGLILAPEAEWSVIEAEQTSVAALYLRYIVILAAIPPFATFLGVWLFGYSRGSMGFVHPSFFGGLARAALQYGLSLPMLYLVAFVLSSLAVYFDGESDDAKALTLIAYSYTPAWIAAMFGLVPGLRWLDILGLYGAYVFYLGMPRMLKCPKDHADLLTLIVMILAIATGTLHAWIVHWILPWEAISR